MRKITNFLTLTPIKIEVIVINQLHPSEITLLRVFRSICECGGIAAAAERNNVAASTLSTQLNQLEERIGLTLCKRGRGGFSVTPEGEKVLDYTNRMFDAMQQFVGDINGLREKLVGRLKIGIIDNTVSNPDFSLGKVLSAYQARFPDVTVSVEVCTAELLEQAVFDRRYDVGIGVKQHGMQKLTYQPLFAERQVLCCAAGHELFTLADEALNDERLCKSDWVIDFFRLPASLPDVDPDSRTVYVSSLEAGLYMILSGKYLGVLPDHYVRPWVQGGEIRELRGQTFTETFVFSVIYHPDQMASTIVSSFVEIAAATLPCSAGPENSKAWADST